MTRTYAVMLVLAVGLSTEIHAASTAATPLEPLCRDYRELTERRPMVDPQQVALLPKFQMLEEVCLTEKEESPTLSKYACTLSSKTFTGSCCAGPWDCLKSARASCESMESLCTGLGAAWSKE